MLTIKFSEEYGKMLNNDGKMPSKVLLMEVFLSDSKDLHSRFVEWDTIYWNEAKNNWAYYKLPTGKVLILLLKNTATDKIFTTIRRYTPSKYEYYKKNRWQAFKIERAVK